MATPIKAVIDDVAFQGLVRGREVVVHGRGRLGPVEVHLILEDIGYTRMLRIIDQAIDDQDPWAGDD